jgi:hypothetical protein
VGGLAGWEPRFDRFARGDAQAVVLISQSVCSDAMAAGPYQTI